MSTNMPISNWKIIPSQDFPPDSDKRHSPPFVLRCHLANTDKTPKLLLGLSSKKAPISAQSSLGELGSSLLRFLQPAVRVKAHIKHHDYLDDSKMGGDFIAASVDSLKAGVSTGGKIIKAGSAQSLPAGGKEAGRQSQKPVPGQVGSGVISITRDPSTPWMQVVTGLLDSCQQSNAATLGAMGAQQYRVSSENRAAMRRKTIGRIINIMSEEEEVAEAAAPEKKDEKAVPTEKKKAA